MGDAVAARVALVIGNAEYTHGPRLANPVEDAVAMAAALERLAFQSVTLLKNATLKTQGNALADFAQRAVGADMAVIYFAGHGMEVDGENFLLPIDAELDHVKRLKVETTRLSDVIDDVAVARRFRLVILDACRDNPFRGRMRGLELTRSLGRGLASIEPQGNTLVAYAARHGTQAKDGAAGGHSPYANALLKHLETPNVDVRIIFGRVRDDVLAMTDDMQEPHIYGTMGGQEVYLKSAALVQGAATAAEESELVRELQEERDWEKAQRTNSVEAFESFIAAWKERSGKFGGEAARKIIELREASDYADAKASKTLPAYNHFLDRWPHGMKSAEVRAKVEALEASAAYDGLKDVLKQSPLETAFDAAPMRAFVERFPNQPSAEAVRKRLAYCEERHAAHLKERHARDFYDQYLRNYPDGGSRVEVERLLAGGGDDRLWIEIQKAPSVALLKRYLAEWPQGRHVEEATKLLPVRERLEKTREVGKLAGGIGIGLGGLAIAGAVLFTAASLLWALGQSAMSYNGSIIDWARKSLAELIAPQPKPSIGDMDVLGRYNRELPGMGLGGSSSAPAPNMSNNSAGSAGSSAANAVKTDPGAPSPSTVDLLNQQAPSKSSLTETFRNISHPITAAPGESEAEFNLRMQHKAEGYRPNAQGLRFDDVLKNAAPNSAATPKP